MNRILEPKCSFCGKAQSAARHLIAGPEGVYICEHCVEICNDVIEKDSAQDPVKDLVSLPTPEEIKKSLDDYIIGQEHAKRVLSVAVYNHYKRVNFNLGQKSKSQKKKNDGIELKKSNILMLGPTGCGKTLMAQTLSRILNVPFAVADATTLTEAGYVGEDVENILLKLIQNADFDIQRAQKGIIYVDEIDKISRKSENMSITRDVSGEGVQQALLKIVESTVASVPPQGGRKHPQQECLTIDTTNILFIFGGAFVGLEKIIQKRTSNAQMGFGGNVRSKNGSDKDKVLLNTQPQDLIQYGIIPEFVGRIPVTVALHELDKDALVKIMTKPRDALTKQYAKLLEMDGVKLTFEDAAIEAVAARAIALNTGARGLRSILEECMLDVMYTIPSDKTIEQVVVTSACINEKQKPFIIRGENRDESESPHEERGERKEKTRVKTA